MLKSLLRVLPLALFVGAPLWVLLSRVGGADILWSYLIGILVSMAVLRLLYFERLDTTSLRPMLFVWLLRYIVFLTGDVVKSGLKVSRMLLSRDDIHAGIIRVSVQDSRNIISGMTAHGITITPGELVVHFGERDGHDVVYVHCLDLEGSAASIDAAQTHRMTFYRGMFGPEETNP